MRVRRPGSDVIGPWNFERIAEVTVVEPAAGAAETEADAGAGQARATGRQEQGQAGRSQTSRQRRRVKAGSEREALSGERSGGGRAEE